jgi:DNA-binding transcriptional LysR family regulator
LVFDGGNMDAFKRIFAVLHDPPRRVLTDRVVNTVEENIDVAIRIGILPDSSMIASRIGSIRLVVCGSSTYQAARGAPKELSDLCNHECIAVDSLATQAVWKFAKGNRAIVLPIHARLCVSTSEAAIQAATAGAGLTRVMSYKMEPARREGALAIVLEEFEQELLPVHIVYVQRKLVPLKLRVFLNWVTPRLKARLVGRGTISEPGTEFALLGNSAIGPERA